MEDFNFDNKIKESLGDLNPLLDNDEIWENIEPHLKKKKKRRIVFWFFLGGIGLISAFLFFGPTSTDLPETSNIQIDQLEIDKVVKEDTEIPVLVDNDIPKKNSNQKIVQDGQESTKRTAKVNHKNMFTSDQKIAEEFFVNNNLNSINTAFSSEDLPVLQLESEDKIGEPGIDLSDLTAIQNTPLKNEKSRQDLPLESKEDLILEAKVEKEKVPSGVESSIEEDEEKEKVENGNKLSREDKIRERAERIADRKKEKEKREKLKKEKKKADKSIKPLKLPKWKFYAQLMGTGIYTLHNVSNSSQLEPQYLKLRKQYVKGTEGFGAEFRIIGEAPSGFLILGGIQYQELHEKLERVETTSETNLENVTQTVTENEVGEVISSTSSMELVTTTTTYNQQFYNQYRFINFPIGIGYAFKAKKNRFRIIGGIDINSYFNFSGSILQKNLTIRDLNSGFANYTDHFNKRVGFGVWSSFEWHTLLNKRLSFVVAPGIQAPLNSLTTGESKDNISHSIIKLKLGVGVNYYLEQENRSSKRKRRKDAMN